MDKPERITRREWIKMAIFITSTIAIYPLVYGSEAEAKTRAKISKLSAHYQNRPHDGEMCGMCKHFIPSGGTAGHGMMGEMGPGMMGEMGPGMMKDGHCQIVQGSISPHGYCVYYVSI